MTNDFADKMIAWQQQYGRHDLPWQQQPNAYRVWVSEIMLQQTQVKTVIPYFQRFIQRFKNINSLANADQDEVLLYWAGLGYYARARNLHRCAQIICQQYQGRFPTTVELLCQLPGIGRSTAGAILSLARDQPVPILDGNVKRIFCRTQMLDGWPGDSQILQQLWKLAEDYTPKTNTAIYNQAMMDLGASICTRRQPNCEQCPISAYCLAYQHQQQEFFPRAKPVKVIPHKQTLMLIMTNLQGAVLLEKRPPVGIWGGLWSLPQCEIKPGININTWVSQQFNLNILDNCTLPSIKHKFSHFTLEIQPRLLKVLAGEDGKVMENSTAFWYEKQQIKTLGLAKPVQRILNEYL